MKTPFLLLIFLTGIFLLQSCGGDGGTDPSTDPPVTTPPIIEATEFPRTAPTFRFHFLAFNLKSTNGGDAGRFKIVAKNEGQSPPTTQDMIDGAGVFRKVDGTDKLVILGFPISSDIGTFYNNTVAGGKRILAAHHATTNNIDQYILKANREYTIYAVKAADTGTTIDADATVYTLKTLKTDPIPTAHGLNEGEYGDEDLFDAISNATTPYYYDIEDTAIVMPWLAFVGFQTADTMQLSIDGTDIALILNTGGISFSVQNTTLKTSENPAILFSSSSTDDSGSKTVQMGTEPVSFPMLLLGSISDLDQIEIKGYYTFTSVRPTIYKFVFFSLDK